jgi:hypothetical protein
MAWWVPLLFGGAFGLGLLRPLLERAFGALRTPPRAGQALGALALFVLAYWLSVAPLDWRLVAALLAALFAVGWWTFDRSPVGLAIALAAFFCGPFVESVLVAAGTFQHLHPVVADVSGWLPSLYLNAAVAMCTTGKWLVDG